MGISVSKKTVLNRGVNTALLAPFVLAAIVVFIAWAITLVPFNEPLPKLDLDFKESFASTLTAVGALLGTVISASVLPEDTVNMSKEAFTALNLLFGVAVVAAGLFYSAMQKPEWVTNKDDAAKQDRKLRGYVGPFLLACLITVWAALGEAWTLSPPRASGERRSLSAPSPRSRARAPLQNRRLPGPGQRREMGGRSVASRGANAPVAPGVFRSLLTIELMREMA